MASKWPKQLPPLTPEQARISDDFMRAWHEALPRYGIVERFNHLFPVRHSPPDFRRTLEIGAGLGEHLAFERMTPEQEGEYHAVELRANMAERLRERFPRVRTVVGDCQKRLPFPDGHFDRILAIHVLEHLPDLPAAIREAYRLCDKARGRFLVVIPCEGSLAYTIARKISAERLYKKRYGASYRWFYTREHINLPPEIFEELDPYFTVELRRFFPIPLPIIWANLCIGLSLIPRPRPLASPA